MLDEIRAKSGQLILRLDGRLLASREDPNREALRWVTRNRHKISGRRTVFVLGAGCGYHLEMLCQVPEVEKVIGLEYNASVVEWSQNRLRQNTKIKIFAIKTKADIFYESEILNGLKTSYSVLKYFPSLAADYSFYEDIFRLLLGRSEEGAKLIFAQRKMFEGFQLTDSNKEAFSIKNILDTIAEADTSNPVNQKWRALRELIR